MLNGLHNLHAYVHLSSTSGHMGFCNLNLKKTILKKDRDKCRYESSHYRDEKNSMIRKNPSNLIKNIARM